MLSRPFVLATIIALPAVATARGFYAAATTGYSRVDGVAQTDLGLEFSTSLPPAVPEITSAGIDGVAFADGDFSGGVVVGYQVNPHLGIELGAARLGDFDSDQSARNPDSATIECDEFALSARLRFPLTQRLSANWQLGLTRSEFDVSGEAEVVFALPDGGGSIVAARKAFSAPENATGYLWGFGFSWQLTPRLSVDLNYTSHDNTVLKVDGVDLGLMVAVGR